MSFFKTATRHALFLIVVWSSLSTNVLAFQDEKNPLAATASLTPSPIDLKQNAELKIQLHLLEGFHVYEESLQVRVIEPEGFLNSQISLAPIVEFYDKNSQKNRRGIQDKAVLTTVIEAPQAWKAPVSRKLQVELTYQACSDTFCLFPKTIVMDLPESIQTTKQNLWTGALTSKNSIMQTLHDHFWFGLLLVFLGGILTSFSPCIFPMIPITIAVLGQNAQHKSRLQNFMTSIFYVLGIALTYSVLGLFVASTGAIFGSTLANPYVVGSICVILFLMALSQFGLFEIQTPIFITRLLVGKKTKQSYFGALLSGLISGVVASPCVGPVLVALLSYVATINSPLLGFLYLFIYALGMGSIFLALGLSNQLLQKLPSSGPWLDVVKNVMGILLLMGFYYYLQFLLPPNFYSASLGFGLSLLALKFGAFLGWQHLNRTEKIRKGAMLACLVIGLVIASDGIQRPQIHTFNANADVSQTANQKETQWQNMTDASFKSALASGKPTIIDFWANWCEACMKLKNQTFLDNKVLERLQNYNLLHFDATKDSPELQKYRDQFDINGLPHVMFFDRTGKLHEDLLLSEFEKSEKFLKRLDSLENKSQ